MKLMKDLNMKKNSNMGMKQMFSGRMPSVAWGMTGMLLITAIVSTSGCRTKAKTQNQTFFTSGSREADQRASQRMAKSEQLAGSGEGTGEKGVKKAQKAKDGKSGGTNTAAQSEQKLSLYERLGAEAGIAKFVDDFTPRLLQDPRVNWSRNGVKKGGFSLGGGKAETWNASPENVTRLKQHLVQFISLATGGPAHYEGKNMKAAHANLHIGNPEFEAAVGDIKASLDNLQIPNKEQKELLAIIESTRPEIVTER
jgi:hemoglobin